MLPDVVTEKLEALPLSSGVYLFKDKKGTVVYVGKAKVLRSRVRSYFQEGSSDNRYFIPILLRTIGDLDTIVTGSEKEAAILENNLIKRHSPRWNIKLRDDKDYISLKLNPKESWPRLWVVRRPNYEKGDASRYFGPYHSATAARRTLHLVNKHFQLRTCTDTEMRARKRPYLQHQIKRCPAPCVLEVDRLARQGERRRRAGPFHRAPGLRRAQGLTCQVVDKQSWAHFFSVERVHCALQSNEGLDERTSPTPLMWMTSARELGDPALPLVSGALAEPPQPARETKAPNTAHPMSRPMLPPRATDWGAHAKSRD